MTISVPCVVSPHVKIGSSSAVNCPSPSNNIRSALYPGIMTTSTDQWWQRRHSARVEVALLFAYRFRGNIIYSTIETFSTPPVIGDTSLHMTVSGCHFGLSHSLNRWPCHLILRFISGTITAGRCYQKMAVNAVIILIEHRVFHDDASTSGHVEAEND